MIIQNLFQGVKKTKPVETFSKLVPIAHKFDQGIERKILAFCKTKEQIDEALEAGAALAGGSDIIKLITVRIKNYCCIY